MPEVKIDGQPVEASVEGEGKSNNETNQKKEETKMKKGILGTVVGIVVSAIMGVLIGALAMFKILMVKEEAPTGFSNETEKESDPEPAADTDAGTEAE